MTEAEWLACDDPANMNHGHVGKWWNWSDPLVRLNARQTRLLGVACARLLIDCLCFSGVRDALDVFERFADENCNRKELRAARIVAEQCLADCDRRIPINPATNWPGGYSPERHAAILLREAGRTSLTIPIGQRWGYWNCLGEHRATAAVYVRDIVGNPFRPVTFDPSWRTSDAVALAQGIYAERAFDRLPILADALQDAGCENADILTHCRDPKLTHVRGCWAVDLVLGKS